MKTFNQWLNEGFFTNLSRSRNKEELPPMSDDQKDTYDKLRNTGMSHEESLKIVMGDPVIHRPVSKSRLDYEKGMDTAFEKGHKFN